MTNITTTDRLRRAWTEYVEDHPRTRTRDAAAALGVSEAELVAADCGAASTRLRADWDDLLLDLEGLGEVMALTRNDAFVHEKVGEYVNARVVPDHRMGQVLGPDIDLRIFFDHWKFGFAVEAEKDGGFKRSLQFFDEHGAAVHKVHLRASSDVGRYGSLVEKYRAEDRGSAVEVARAAERSSRNPDDHVDVAALQTAWEGLKDPHDFFFLLRDFGIERQAAYRLVGGEFAREVSTESLRRVFESAAADELPLMIFVGNRGCLQIHTGPIFRLEEAGGWYNVLDPGFSLHVREAQIASAWVVRKPTSDGHVHSVEFFNVEGEVVCYLFGERKEGRRERPAWRDLVAGL